MNLEKIKEFFANLSTHDLPSGAAALIGLGLLLLVFKTQKILMKLVFFLIAAGLFVGAYWWYQHRG
jgi:hypothetical protein